jgi:alpha-L-fucosidase 2
MSANILRYDREAANWDEALPLGNGRMGAMVFSGAVNERLALNDDTLWSGCGEVHDIPGGLEGYIHARDLALAGKYDEAQAVIEAECLGKNTQRYLPLGDLLIDMVPYQAEPTTYRRTLDIGKALHSMQYSADGVTLYREVFVSHPDNVLVMRLWGDSAGAVSFTAGMACQLKSEIFAEAGEGGYRLVLEGQADPTEDENPARQGMKYIAIADFEVENGKLEAENDAKLRIINADSVTIRMAWRTNFKDAFTPPMLGDVPYRVNCERDIKNARMMSYDELRERHINDYQQLFNRMDISFEPSNGGENPLSEKAPPDKPPPEKNLLDTPLPERLAQWENAEQDPSLFALLFQYGRYLMISASRPGSQPMNLQGIWSHHFWPPWSGNFTLNINTEMNYWPAAPLNLAECHEPLTKFVTTLRRTGGQTAQKMYNARGFVVHHNSDIWGMSTPVAPGNQPGASRWAFWPLAQGWLAAQLYNQYLYTRNENFLHEKAYPAVRDAARFFLDVLVEDENGHLVFAPSTSPENDFVYEGKPLSVCKTATMTTAIIKETLTNYITIANNAAYEAPFLPEAASALKRLPPYAIGTRGELLEWSEELPEAEPTHRHTSHLYPLYPGREIKAGTALAEACRRTLDLRGDESTGWALAWRINFFARLGDGERAFSFLQKQLRPSEGWRGGCYPNLFGSHPPFQIDSNFGAAAGMAEMLVQSSPDGTVHLLPALPRALGTGRVRGLRAMGGLTVDMDFADRKLVKAEITMDAELSEQKFKFIYNNMTREYLLHPGKTIILP